MKLALLLEKLRPHPEIETEERIHPDGTRVFIFSSQFPFPRVPGPVWYVIVLRPGDDEIDEREIEAMLRHLWMFQLDIFPEAAGIDLVASAEDDET